MIAGLTLAVESLGDVEAAGGFAAALHQQTAEAFDAHARLFFRDADHKDAFIRAAEDLPPDSFKRWEELLIRMEEERRLLVLSPPTPCAFAGNLTLDEVCSQWGPRNLDLAVLPQAMAAALGLRGPAHVAAGGAALEIATAESVLVTDSLTQLKALEGRVWEQGEERDEFWRQVLAPLARGAQTITVLDRFVYKELVRRRERGATAPYGFLVWFLTMLDRVVASGAEVEIIGSVGEDGAPGDVADAASLVSEIWPASDRKRIATIHVVGAPWAGQGRPTLAHDRHVSFDFSRAVRIHAGFDRLRSRQIWDSDGAHWSYYWRPDQMENVIGAEIRVREFDETLEVDL